MLSFVAIKFLALALSSARSLILAAILGPQSYGVFGTLLLIQQYLSYAALGMREGVTVYLAQRHGDPVEVASVHASALMWAGAVGVVVLVVSSTAPIVVPGMGHYLPWVGAISLLSISNEILINANRDQHKLKKIALLEVAYNGAPLATALLLWREITVTAVLASLAVGLLTSVTIYLATLPRVRLACVSARLIRRLIGIGLPIAILSAVTLVVNSVYVALANWLATDDVVGLVVFASNLCTIVLFALNTVAWAATSRSMRSLYAENASTNERARAERLRTLFRLGLVAAPMVCLASDEIFHYAMTAYVGAGILAFYFCLFQAHGLLLFDELNRLNITGRSAFVILGYLLLLALILAVHFAVPSATIATLAIAGIGAYFPLGIAAIWHGERHGLARHHDASKWVFATFPIVCALLYAGIGMKGALIVCVGYGSFAITSHRSFQEHVPS